MSKSSAKQLTDDGDQLYRVESIPPPDGEDAHDSVTKVGDWALALAEKERACTTAKATAKVEAFDLAAALANAMTPSLPPPAPAPLPIPASATHLRASAVPEALANDDDDDDDDGFLVVSEATIDVAEESPAVAEPLARSHESPSRTKASFIAAVGSGMLELLIVAAVVAASALIMSR